ncbi:hypothetical protein (nucleomorph) [Guillardia theta]|uniref:Uncharacterized protein n=1 Tax=Guillardia theta TaxID=55529 RepID=Q98SD0_GUITH|nr:hypothetical protein GTHECHR3010 [Guillardia theta]AAK39654.1 hypothetical protein [Guillardia theta]
MNIYEHCTNVINIYFEEFGNKNARNILYINKEIINIIFLTFEIKKYIKKNFSISTYLYINFNISEKLLRNSYKNNNHKRKILYNLKILEKFFLILYINKSKLIILIKFYFLTFLKKLKLQIFTFSFKLILYSIYVKFVLIVYIYFIFKIEKNNLKLYNYDTVKNLFLKPIYLLCFEMERQKLCFSLKKINCKLKFKNIFCNDNSFDNNCILSLKIKDYVNLKLFKYSFSLIKKSNKFILKNDFKRKILYVKNLMIHCLSLTELIKSIRLFKKFKFLYIVCYLYFLQDFFRNEIKSIIGLFYSNDFFNNYSLIKYNFNKYLLYL